MIDTPTRIAVICVLSSLSIHIGVMMSPDAAGMLSQLLSKEQKTTVEYTVPVSFEIIEAQTLEVLPEESVSQEVVEMLTVGKEPKAPERQAQTVPPVASKQPAAEKLEIVDDESKKIFINYYRVLCEKIRSNSVFPESAVSTGEVGTVGVTFKIMEDGSVEWVEVALEARNNDLNTAAVRAIQKSSPFPKIPEVLQKNSLILNVKIAFQFKKSR